MKICSKCKKEFSDEAIFCDECGEKLELSKAKENAQFVFCPHCGVKVGEEYEFCPECGKSISIEVIRPIKEGKTKGTNTMNRKKIGIGILLVAVFGGIIGSICLLTSHSIELTNQLFYLKNDSMYITDGTADGISKIAKEVPMESEIAQYITLQEEKKRVIYLDKVESLWRQSGYSLYYRSLSDVESEPTKIDSDISGYYQVTTDGNKIFYQNTSRDLYVYDFEKKEKVANEVTGYSVNKDGTKMVYVSDGDLYYKAVETNPIKLGKAGGYFNGGEDYLFYVTADYSTIYYVDENDTLYKSTTDGNKTKIADNVISEIVAYDEGGLYYSVNKKEQLKLSEFIVDDCAEKDAKQEAPKEPKAPEEPFWGDYGYEKEAEYEKAWNKYEKEYKKYEQKLTEYQEACAAYEQIENRNTLRQEMTSETITNEIAEFYYYNGSESVLIGRSEMEYEYSGTYVSYNDFAKEKPIVTYVTTDEFDLPKIKLSEVYSVTDALETAMDQLYELQVKNKKKQLAIGANVQPLEDITGRYNIHNDGNRITYIDDGDLMQMDIVESKLQKPVTYDTEVKYYWFSSQAKNNIYYIKDYDKEEDAGVLYYNKEKIAENVCYIKGICERPQYKGGKLYYVADYDISERVGSLGVWENGKTQIIGYDIADYSVGDDGTVYYTTDWDEDDSSSTLKMWNGKDSTVIASDIYQYVYFNNGDIYYLKDYDMADSEGELYIYERNTEEKLDDDVQLLLNPSEMEIQ